jgi:hypothetical protein
MSTLFLFFFHYCSVCCDCAQLLCLELIGMLVVRCAEHVCASTFCSPPLVIAMFKAYLFFPSNTECRALIFNGLEVVHACSQ